MTATPTVGPARPSPFRDRVSAMNKEEQVGYLANIYRLLLADGAVERVEEKVFEEISREIRAGFFERKGGCKRNKFGCSQFGWKIAGRKSCESRNTRMCI